MAVINGTATWGFVPYDDDSSNLADTFGLIEKII